jgi:hypothetical protein
MIRSAVETTGHGDATLVGQNEAVMHGRVPRLALPEMDAEHEAEHR